jgi:hypothetical protein
MIRELIQSRFGVSYHSHYLATVLHNLGFSYQKARFVSDGGITPIGQTAELTLGQLLSGEIEDVAGQLTARAIRHTEFVGLCGSGRVLPSGGPLFSSWYRQRPFG